jgi:hypothetical protein
MNTFLLDAAPSVRQASAYGIGVAAQFGGEPYLALCSGSLQNLFTSISAPVPEDSNEGIYARENALSAVGKICHFASASGSFDLNAVLGQWISALPIVKDEEEAAHTYGYLLDLLEAQHPVAVSLKGHIVYVLTEALAAPELLQGESQKELAGRVVSVLRALLSGMSEADRGALWNRLSAEKRQSLQTRGYF